MTDAAYDPNHPAEPTIGEELTNGLNTRATAVAVYALFMAALFTGGLSAIGGAVIAQLARRDASSLLRSHFAYQMRTFWTGLAVAAAGAAVLPFSRLGIVLLVAAGLYVMTRGAVGLGRAMNNRPARAPAGLLR